MQARKARFGAFEIDLHTGELRKHGLRIRLQDQPFQVLRLLLERPGEIVTREELHSRLWPENTFVDFDVGLNTAIKRLRDALRDSAENSHYIETIPRRGYRFIAAVEPIVEATAQLPDADGQGKDVVRSPRRRMIWIAGASVAVVGSLLLILNIGKVRQWTRRGATPIHSIAVLPLDNLSGDSNQDYFVDGMTDALTSDLGKIGQLRVVSRTSTIRYKGAKKSVQEIAKELEVDALVEGSVARSGDRFRITANLVQVNPERLLWANSFEANIRNVLDLQDEASRAIADAIQIKLTPQEKARLANAHSINPAAYDAYLQARYFEEKTLPGGDPAKPIAYYELAIKNDPAWALPHAGLAEIYHAQAINLAIPNQYCAKSKDTALEALKRDSESAAALTVLADLEFYCEWNWAGAEKDIQRAIEIDPNLAQAHSSRGRYLLTLGRTDEMLQETKRAVELDPLAFRIRFDRWLSLFMAGQYDEAFEQCRKIKELNPEQNLGYLYCGEVDVQRGKFSEAVQEDEQALKLAEGRNPRAIAYLARAYALAGRRKEAEGLLANLIKMSKQRHVHPDLIAIVYLGLGQDQAAMDWLETAYQVRARDLLEIKYDPRFYRLRNDPRFIDLIQRIGFAS